MRRPAHPPPGDRRTHGPRCTRGLRRRRVAGGGTFLVMEHNRRFVLESCDSGVLRADGRIVGEGDPAEQATWPSVLTDYFGTYLLDLDDAPTGAPAAR